MLAGSLEAIRRQTHHMKGISHQCQRVHGKAGNEFNEEEDDIDAEHDADPGRLGERHGGRVD